MASHRDLVCHEAVTRTEAVQSGSLREWCARIQELDCVACIGKSRRRQVPGERNGLAEERVRWGNRQVHCGGGESIFQALQPRGDAIVALATCSARHPTFVEGLL